MLLSVSRTIFLYLLTILAVRYMGKRQIGELRPTDLVTTILISNLASVPVEETNLPIFPAIAPIVVIVCAEVILSQLESQSLGFAKLLSGESVAVILNGKLQQQALRNLRFNMDDLLEALRQKDIFDITEVAAAIVETSGKVTVLKKSENSGGFPAPVVSDGTLNELGITLCGKDRIQVENLLKENFLNAEDMVLVQLTGEEITACIKKEN